MRVRKTGTFMGSVVAVLLMTAGLSAPAGGVPGMGAKPTVSTLVPSVTSIPHGGGDVLLSATVSMPDGSAMPDGTCQFISNKPVYGLPATVACVAGAVSYGVTIPANTSPKALSVKFRLAVTGTPGSNPVKSSWSDTVMLDPFLGLASAIAAGAAHTCAITGPTGTVRCWGDNSYGQLGNKTFTNSLVPVTVKGLSGATAIAAGIGHTCALVSGGKVKCWGRNAEGELGNGTNAGPQMCPSGACSNVPVSVTDLSGATAIAAGAGHTCAMRIGAWVQCWGQNNDGQLGDGNYANSTVPVGVTGLSGAIAIAAGGFYTCAVLWLGGVQCWGKDSYVASNNTVNSSNVPMSVTGVTEVTAIAAGDGQTCAVIYGGTVDCWGKNLYGQLGNGTNNPSWVPVSVTGLTAAVIAIAAGGDHTCALLSGGTVQCWGYNAYAQLGNLSINPSNVPQAAFETLPPTAFIGIAAGYRHTCVLTSDGWVKCGGMNYDGQLGNGNKSNSLFWTSVVGL